MSRSVSVSPERGRASASGISCLATFAQSAPAEVMRTSLIRRSATSPKLSTNLDFAKAERLIALNSPMLQLCMYTCMILISWLGAKAVIASGNNPALGLTTGNLTALFTYSIQVLMSLMMLPMIFAMLTIARSLAERIAEILNEKTDIQNPHDPVRPVKDGSVCYQAAKLANAQNFNHDAPAGVSDGFEG